MNFFELVIKQMRQRALSTWLTMLSVTLAVALATAVMILHREGEHLFGQKDFGYDVLIGPPKGSPLQLTLNTVYHLDISPGNVPFELYHDLARKGPTPRGHADYKPYVRNAVPFMVGDSYRGRRIVGTAPAMFGFDDAGQPLAGYDAMGHPLKDFVDWHTPEDERPEKMPVRATTMEYRLGMKYELAQGRMFRAKRFEAVVGSEIAETLNLKLYDDKLSEEENEKQGGAFRATHGMPAAGEKPDIHRPHWRIVGIQPTHTANDRVLFVPYVSLFAIAEHETGLIDQALIKAKIDPSRIPPDRIDEVLSKLGLDPRKMSERERKKFKMQPRPTSQPTTAPADVGDLIKGATIRDEPKKQEEEGDDPDAHRLDANGDIVPDLPEEEWVVSAVLVQSRGAAQAQWLMYNFKVIDDRATAVNPAEVMRDFFNTFLAGTTWVLKVISYLVTVVAAVSILVSIYNSVSARMREIAILRALGATRTRILSLICVEAGMIGLIGSLLGIVAGHLLSAAGSVFLQQMLGEGINWLATGTEEWIYLLAVTGLAALAGLVPAMKAYRSPVAANLVAE